MSRLDDAIRDQEREHGRSAAEKPTRERVAKSAGVEAVTVPYLAEDGAGNLVIYQVPVLRIRDSTPLGALVQRDHITVTQWAAGRKIAALAYVAGYIPGPKAIDLSRATVSGRGSSGDISQRALDARREFQQMRAETPAAWFDVVRAVAVDDRTVTQVAATYGQRAQAARDHVLGRLRAGLSHIANRFGVEETDA